MNTKLRPSFKGKVVNMAHTINTEWTNFPASEFEADEIEYISEDD